MDSGPTNRLGPMMSRTSQRMTVTLSTQDLSKLLSEDQLLDASGHVGMKVIFTLGPACYKVETIQSMLEAGASCARLLLGWGTSKFQAQCLANLRVACSTTGKVCGLIVETKGREVMIKSEPTLDSAGIPRYGRRLEANANDKIVLTTRAVPPSGGGADWLLPLQQTSFPSMCSHGDILVLAQYLSVGTETTTLRLSVVDISDTDIICIALNSASMEGALTVGLTDNNTAQSKQTTEPVLTASDMSALKGLAGSEIDFVSLSHTESPADVHFTRKILASIGLSNVKILAKLERGRTLVKCPDILKQADGIILSRGKLSTTVSPGRLSLMQKAVISRINLHGKPVLLTRVAGSLVHSKQLSRADEHDIISAVMDGCDGIILGAETHAGIAPVSTISALQKVCKQAESCVNNDIHQAKLEDLLGTEPGAGTGEQLAAQIAEYSMEERFKACLAFCQSGVPLDAVRRCHLKIPVFVPIFTSKRLDARSERNLSAARLARLCSIYGGLIPVTIHEKNPEPGPAAVTKALKACMALEYLDDEGTIIVAQKKDAGYSVEETNLEDIAGEASDSESDLQSIIGRDLDAVYKGMNHQSEGSVVSEESFAARADGPSHGPGQRYPSGRPGERWKNVARAADETDKAEVPLSNPKPKGKGGRAKAAWAAANGTAGPARGGQATPRANLANGTRTPPARSATPADERVAVLRPEQQDEVFSSPWGDDFSEADPRRGAKKTEAASGRAPMVGHPLDNASTSFRTALNTISGTSTPLPGTPGRSPPATYFQAEQRQGPSTPARREDYIPELDQSANSSPPSPRAYDQYADQDREAEYKAQRRTRAPTPNGVHGKAKQEQQAKQRSVSPFAKMREEPFPPGGRDGAYGKARAPSPSPVLNTRRRRPSEESSTASEYATARQHSGYLHQHDSSGYDSRGQATSQSRNRRPENGRRARDYRDTGGQSTPRGGYYPNPEQEYFREAAATPRGGMTPRAGTPRAGTPRRQQHVEASPAIPLYSYNPPYIGASQHSSYADDPYQDAIVRGRDPNGMDMQFDPQGGRAWRMEQDRDGRKIYFEVDQEPQMNAPLYRSASQELRERFAPRGYPGQQQAAPPQQDRRQGYGRSTTPQPGRTRSGNRLQDPSTARHPQAYPSRTAGQYGLVTDYSATQVRTVDEARSILATSRSRYSGMPAASPRHSALHVGGQSLPVYSATQNAPYQNEYAQPYQDYGYQQYGQGRADRSRTPQAPRHASVNLTMGVENERARVNRAPSPYRPATRYASPMPGGDPRHVGYESRTPRAREQEQAGPFAPPARSRPATPVRSRPTTPMRGQGPPAYPQEQAAQAPQRSITPMELDQYELPEGVPLRPQSRPQSTPRTPRGGSPTYGRRVELPATFEDRPSLNAAAIPRVVGGKLVPSFQVQSLPSRDSSKYYVEQQDKPDVMYETQSSIPQMEVMRAGTASLPVGRPMDRRRPQKSSQLLGDEEFWPEKPVGMHRSASFNVDDYDSPPRRQGKYNTTILNSAPDDYAWEVQRERRPGGAEAESAAPQPRAEQRTAAHVQLEHRQKAPQAKAETPEIQPASRPATAPADAPSAETEPLPEATIGGNIPEASPGAKTRAAAAEAKLNDYFLGQSIKQAHMKALYQQSNKADQKRFKWLSFGNAKEKKGK